MAKVTVTLEDGLRADVQAGEHRLIVDEPIADGGTNLGMGATELLLGALGACAAITARLYARRKGWPLERVEITAEQERFDKADYAVVNPGGYTGEGDVLNEFRQTMTFIGDLTAEQKTRLLEIAGRCPVHRLFTTPHVLIERLADETVTAALMEEGA